LGYFANARVLKDSDGVRRVMRRGGVFRFGKGGWGEWEWRGEGCNLRHKLKVKS
jgi:hypothetical protein